MASLADIRKRLAEQESKRNRTFNDEPSPIYPHWNINDGDTAIVRFLEDGNPENPYFWVERAMFKFPFNGIKGDPSAGNVIVQVPCMEMYGEKDAVLDEVRTWFKDSSMEEMGRRYWKKRSYIFQGFVRKDPMDLKAPENPIRRFIINPQIFNLIKNGLIDPEIEYLPTDPVHGLDFRIIKITKGGYSDYTTSSWARKETPLTDEELEAIEKYGLSNLADFLPPKPTEEVQKVIREMFEASVDGEPYDPERWGAYYTPPGMERSEETTTTDTVANSEVTSEPEKTTSEELDFLNTEEPLNSKAKKAEDILALIRQRQQQ